METTTTKRAPATNRGLPRTGNPGDLTDEQCAKILVLHGGEYRMTKKDLARRFNVSVGVISQVLKKLRHAAQRS